MKFLLLSFFQGEPFSTQTRGVYVSVAWKMFMELRRAISLEQFCQATINGVKEEPIMQGLAGILFE